MKRILVADDHPIMLSGIEGVLRDTGYEVVATAADGAAVIEALQDAAPDILVLDVRMPGHSGLDILRSLRREGDMRPIVLLTADLSDQALLEAVELGVNGIIMKEGAQDLLVTCLDHVANGRRWIDREVMERALNLKLKGSEQTGLAKLSNRERQISWLVAQGRRNRDIAAELGITEGTVKVRLHKIYEKLGIGSRTELAILAMESQAG
jgi:two-component system, NarL family, nitrate/nitrite response regulator NarL